jgi:hypothetical protein
MFNFISIIFARKKSGYPSCKINRDTSIISLLSGKYSVFHALEWACMYHNYHSRSSLMIRALWPPGKLFVLFTGKLHKKVRKVRRWNVIDSEILRCLSWFDWLILWFLSWFDWLILDVFVITDCNLVSNICLCIPIFSFRCTWS